MLENIGLTLAAFAVLGVLVLGYVAWRTKRRMQDAQADQQAQRGGGGPTRPVVPK